MRMRRLRLRRKGSQKPHNKAREVERNQPSVSSTFFLRTDGSRKLV